MTTIHAHVDQSIDQTRASLRQVAGEHQWALAVAEDDPDTLEFRNVVAPKPGDESVSVRLEPASATKTNLEFRTRAGRGRGGRNIRTILNALGAVKD
jgi:hypothetical protein